MRWFHILSEAHNYEGMFANLIKNLPDKKGEPTRKLEYYNYTKGMIDWAKQTLKKDDRIVWFLRWIRVEISPNINEAIEELNKKLKTHYTYADYVNGNTLKQQLQHSISLPIVQIQNTVFDKQSPQELLNSFKAIEKEWKLTSNKRNIITYKIGQEPKMLIKFPDGYAWFDLEKHRCDIEAKAMGHCGNPGSSDVTLLSLRKLVLRTQTETQWHPVLTFILNDDGYLGEMKGRGNDKPAERYHPYIVALLKSKYVEGIKGGGYLPSHNFKMSDLDDKTREKLIKKKPGLAELSDLYEKEGMTDRVLDLVSRGLSNNNIDDYYSYDKKNKLFVLDTWEDFDRFVGAIYDEDVRKILDIALGDADFQLDRKDISESFIDTVNELPDSIQENIITRAKTSHGVEDAARKLMKINDAWFQIFKDVYNDTLAIDDEAWERLFKYVSDGWTFASYHVYTNIPSDNFEEFKKFVLDKKEVSLFINEKYMIDYASFEGDDESYDDDIGYCISKMKGDSGMQAEWETIDSENQLEHRQENGLVKRDSKYNYRDVWLSQISTDGVSLVDRYIAALHGRKDHFKIADKRQKELKFEGKKYKK